MKQSILTLLIFITVAGCSVTVKETFDKQVDFSRYKTYCWMAGCEFNFTGPTYLNDSLAKENIRKAIEAELRAKGLILSDDNPDLLVGFTITVKDEQAVVYHRAEDTPIFIKPLDLDKEVINYLKGSLIIGLADAKESRMVWQSNVSAYTEMKPDLSEQNIRKGIKQALKNYPPIKN
jgi:hypothetical protein